LTAIDTAPFVVAMAYVPFSRPLLMFEHIGMTAPHCGKSG
jgi:hypothetical protein